MKTITGMPVFLENHEVLIGWEWHKPPPTLALDLHRGSLDLNPWLFSGRKIHMNSTWLASMDNVGRDCREILWVGLT